MNHVSLLKGGPDEPRARGEIISIVLHIIALGQVIA